MLICIFARGIMTSMLELEPGSGIADEHVTHDQPLVRAMVVQRLEMMWRTCEPHIQIPLEDGVPLWKADPRFLEVGIRLMDRLMRLYRLEQPQSAPPDDDAGSLDAQRELARKQIRELTARMGPEA